MVILSASAGLAAYVFNIIVGRMWGASLLGHMLGIIGFASVLILPASFLTFPVARWAAQTMDWRRRLPIFQAAMLAPGTVTAAVVWLFHSYLGNVLHIPSQSWWVPIVLFLAPSYVGLVNLGVLMGRRAYGSMGAIAIVPTLGKLIFLVIGLWMGSIEGARDALWAMVLAGWVGALLGTFLTYVAGDPTDRVVPSGTVWALAWTGIAVRAWLDWDVVIASAILSAGNIALYAAAATIGKIPFHLTSLVANTGIGEEGWGRQKRNGFRIVIILVGLATVVIILLGGHLVLALFRLSSGKAALIGYLTANTLLALAYYEVGADAQEGRHTWLPLAFGLVLWSVIAELSRPGAIGLAAELVSVLLVSYGVIMVVRIVPGVNVLFAPWNRLRLTEVEITYPIRDDKSAEVATREETIHGEE